MASPGARLPEQRTFSQPSSSFNASSWVASGVAPPLGGVNAAGTGEGYKGREMRQMKTALILPGQGSQYVSMSEDLYNLYPSARRVWHQAEKTLTAFIKGQPVDGGDAFQPGASREKFEKQLLVGTALEKKLNKDMPLHQGWFLDLVFRGDQLQLTSAENAKPAIFTCTMALLTVLQEEFGINLAEEKIDWVAGHGTGEYAALVIAKSMHFNDAIRAIRYRGLEVMNSLANNPVLFPEGCTRPESVYETWGFTNAASGKGNRLLGEEEGVVGALATQRSNDGRRSSYWKGTQVSAVVLRPGRLDDALQEVEVVQSEIRNGAIPGVACDEFVAVSNINSQLQIVVSGTRVGVSYLCDRLRFKQLGARAVNLPVAGPFHTSMVADAAKAYKALVDEIPIAPHTSSMHSVSSVTGEVHNDVERTREDLGKALALPVLWMKTINTLIENDVHRFVCVGPGRACAYQLSKELAFREQKKEPHGIRMNPSPTADTLDLPGSEYEVWSVSTSQTLEQLAHALKIASHDHATI
ncbi:[acyl-carrier-protein] S-malonyltransferase [Malassezia vespertilionis]|uniref:[acyl-carrier-protein] S-malonyltransferase n=1 Tax=Malassezia vespertilionis TaxID=2020962 RepID=UPI0024B1E290|nr:[acyl-carrier-protein] S-malonyltransferase [Malassezia vespertilionis]WFD07603.1 [acyl-carrier-protein] S-malonyltransferase [Malassezia vespertilionis]